MNATRFILFIILVLLFSCDDAPKLGDDFANESVPEVEIKWPPDIESTTIVDTLRSINSSAFDDCCVRADQSLGFNVYFSATDTSGLTDVNIIYNNNIIDNTKLGEKEKIDELRIPIWFNENSSGYPNIGLSGRHDWGTFYIDKRSLNWVTWIYIKVRFTFVVYNTNGLYTEKSIEFFVIDRS